MLRKVLLAGVFAASTLAAVPAFADVTVGNHDSGNCYPFACNDSGSNVGQSFDYYEIYNAAAFGGPLTFNTISFEQWPNLGQGPGVLNGQYNISFATTTGGLNQSFPVAPLANVATFFNGALGGNYPGTFSITGAAYSYDPMAGDLVMHVVVNNQDNVRNGSGNGYMWADYTGSNVTRAYNGQGTLVGALSTTFSGGSGAPEPQSWALMLVGFGGLGAVLRRRRAPALA